MNFPLSKLEQYVDEGALVVGERLFEEQKVQDLREVEKHLWVATVDGKFEVELQITPSKVQNFSCECPTFLEKKQCAHLIAGLFALRQKMQQLTAEKQAKKKRKRNTSSPKRLTPSVILENVSLDELTDFVRKYASRDRNFALALKARFAGVVEFFDTKEKYLQVLESSIEAARKTDRMISYRGARKLEKVLSELLQQADIALAQKHFTTTLYIAESIIEKVTPILRKIEREQELVVQRIKDAFDLLHTLLESDPAPALQQEIWTYCKGESTKLTYRLNNLAIPFYQVLQKMANTPDKVNELLALLDELLGSPHTNENTYVRLLLAKLSLLEKNDRQEEASVLIRQNLQQPEILLYALRQLQQREDWEAARKLAQEGLKFTDDATVRGQLEDILLDIAKQQYDEAAQATFARKRLLTTLDIAYFHTFKIVMNGAWPQIRQELLRDIKQGTYSLERRNLIAAIYAEEGLQKELFEFIKKNHSLDLLQEHLEQFSAATKKQALQLYEELLDTYLENHVGRKSSQRVRDKIGFLYKIQEHQLADRLVEKIRAAYPERNSLLDELMVF